MSSPDGSDKDILTGFLDDYFAECDEHLTTIRRLLLASDSAPGLSLPALDELFRSFHSIKGLSGMTELREAELLAHHMESYLRVLRSNTATLTPSGLSALIEGTRALEAVIAARREDAPLPPIGGIVNILSSLDDAERLGTDARSRPNDPASTIVDRAALPRWRVSFAPTAALAAQGVGVDYVRGLLREAGDIVDASPKVSSDGGISFEFTFEGALTESEIAAWRDQGIEVAAAAVPETPSPAVPASPSALLAPSHYVRVDLARLDDLMRMIGDLVISRARLTEALSMLEPHVPPVAWRGVQDSSLAIERQLRDLREGVMRVRLVPVGEIFRRMPFVVRDLARELAKNVELEIVGESTEIDKFLIERMLDPVLHLVRNAVSHAIEPPAERLAAGKPEVGRITLTATGVGDLVVLEIADDGRGVDPDTIARRARAAGLPVPDGPLDADAVLQILCAPGFSTRDAADRASGRGVGMAVVQTTVQELGGKLSLDSRAGAGARFVIELPVTLAITEAIIARVGTETFAIPQSAVRELIEVDPASISRVERGEMAPHRGIGLPIVRLSDVFGIAATPRRALHVFVVGDGAAAIGLAVDRIVGQREIVVRTLADALTKVEGVVGATDLGDGRAVLILDAGRLSAAARAKRLARPRVRVRGRS